MKTKMLFWCACACLVAGLSFFTVSCSEDPVTPEPSLEISPAAITANNQGGTYTVTVTSNTTWQAVSSNTAIATVDPASGSDTRDITVTVLENSTTETRSANITVSSGALSKSVAITQSASSVTPSATITTGDYVVSKTSFRKNNEDASTTNVEYQGNFNDGKPNEVTITKEGDLYKISDLFGGFYVPGREGYNENDHVCWGTLSFDGSKFTLIEGKSDSWGTGWKENRVLESSYNAANHTITLAIPWGKADATQYTFHITLVEKAFCTTDCAATEWTNITLPYTYTGKYVALSKDLDPASPLAVFKRTDAIHYKITIAEKGTLDIYERNGDCGAYLYDNLSNVGKMSNTENHGIVNNGENGGWNPPCENIVVEPGTYYLLVFYRRDSKTDADNYNTDLEIKFTAEPVTEPQPGEDDPTSLQGFTPVGNEATGTTWTLHDARDDKEYTVVKMLDGKIWMAKNLNYTEGMTLVEELAPADGWPENAYACMKDGGCEHWGAHYPHATKATLCPTGWRLPASNGDWSNLFDKLHTQYGDDNAVFAAINTDESGYWNPSIPHTFTNVTGFSAIASGSRQASNENPYDHLYNLARMMSSEANTLAQWGYVGGGSSPLLMPTESVPTQLFPIRCVKQ